ncbi:uncharacterized protein LOC118424507 [Branchiostoma floridae]|nr:uncharacterized protein LOC118424507 [Branchiostoma floridae]
MTDNQPASSNSRIDVLSLTGIGIVASVFALFAVILAFAGFKFLWKKRQQRAADHDRPAAVNNPAFDEEIYDVITDEGFIGVATLPPPIPPPLKQKDDDYLDVYRSVLETSNVQDSSAYNPATPGDPIKNHTHKSGHLPDDTSEHEDNTYLDLNGSATKDMNVSEVLTPTRPICSFDNSIHTPVNMLDDADTDQEYTYPTRPTDPYQPLGGSYERHHDYQGLHSKGGNGEQSQNTDHDYNYPKWETDSYISL